MNIEELKKQLDTLIDDNWDEAFSVGYGEGYTDATETFQEDLEEEKSLSFSEGVKKEQERIQSVLQMMFNFAMENNKMTEAKGWKNAMDIIKPIDIDYSEEAYRKSMEEDGF